MGNSGKFAVVTGIVALGLLVLTGMTLALPVFFAFLGVLTVAFLAAVGEILVRGRRVTLLAAGASFSLAVGFSLAFLSTWELAFAGQRSFIGTPLPTGDPDDYFYGAGAAAAATLVILFLGAAWPAGLRARQGTSGRRLPGQTRAGRPRPGQTGTTRTRSTPRGTSQGGKSQRGAATGRSRTGVPAQARRTAAARAAAAGRTASQRTSTQRTAAQRSATQRSATQRTPQQ